MAPFAPAQGTSNWSVCSAGTGGLHDSRGADRRHTEVDRNGGTCGCGTPRLPRITASGTAQVEESRIGVEVMRGCMGNDHIGEVPGSATIEAAANGVLLDVTSATLDEAKALAAKAIKRLP